MIPEQRPDRRPRSLRPRGDRYRLPSFSGPHQLDTQRYEPDPGEPDTLSLRDLLDVPWGRAGVCVALAVVGLIVFLGSGPMPV